jgi:homoserine O-acetyltransferase
MATVPEPAIATATATALEPATATAQGRAQGQGPAQAHAPATAPLPATAPAPATATAQATAPATVAAVLELGDVALQFGGTLRAAKLAYLRLGNLNAARDNVIVMPTYYTGIHTSYLPLIGPGKALNPERYCIVIPNMFCNGESTSPSNSSADSGNAQFPVVSIRDNVEQQAKLVFDVVGARRVALCCGWSLGGVQAYQWAVSFPDRIDRLLPYCAASRTSPYNTVFLEGLRAAMRADSCYALRDPTRRPIAGLRAFARVYAGWAYSHEFYRDGLYQTLGYGSVEDLLARWEDDHLTLDAYDLLAMLDTWQRADISAGEPFVGDHAAALAAIRADTILLPCSTDRYFPPADNHSEAERIPRCEVRTLNSPYGHCALSPGRVPAAFDFLDDVLRELLNR